MRIAGKSNVSFSAEIKIHAVLGPKKMRNLKEGDPNKPSANLDV